MALASLASSVSRALEMDSFKFSNFPTTLSRVSLEKVEATCKRAAIGLDFPILANSAKAPSTEVGVMVLSFSMTKSRAAKTEGPYSCLFKKSA
jgi:hypothetical protein